MTLNCCLHKRVPAQKLTTTTNYYHSKDAYRDHYVADRKHEKLALRRKQLADLLHQENMMYQAELRTRRSHPGMVSDIKSKLVTSCLLYN